MHIKNTQHHYGIVAILLHWLMAAIIIGLLILGLYMVGLPISLWKLKLYGWHKEFGILIFMLVFVRLIWRFSTVTPALPDYMPYWQKLAARSVHYAFYLIMFAMPITGWLISSAAGLPASFFGLFTLPDLINPTPTLEHLFAEIHEWLGYSLIILIGMHVGAVAQHYILYKDNLLRRMWS